MKKTLLISLLVLLLAFMQVSSAFASPGQAEIVCPDSFSPHPAMDHDGHDGEEHVHAGTDVDRNGDGLICFKHVGVNESIHVHIDNIRP